MRCYHFAACLLLLLSSCQAFSPAKELEQELLSRGSRSGSKSPSSSKSREKTPPRSTRLFGVDISQPPKRPASVADPGPSTQARPAQSSHTHPAQSSHAHPALSAQTTHPGSMHPSQTGQPRPVRSGFRGRPFSPMYAEWSKTLDGPLKIKPGGRPRIPLSDKGKASKSSRYESDRRYREKQKLKKQMQQLKDKHSSGHQQHPPKGGGPGSPGAGSHAISKT